MKKLALTFAIVLGLSMTTFAGNDGGGLFQRGMMPDGESYGMSYTNEYRSGMPLLPSQHGTENDLNAPVGTGIALLTAFGAAYIVAKKRREE